MDYLQRTRRLRRGGGVRPALHASLLARLDRLAPTREVAQIGAALGRSFSHELINAFAQMPQQKLDEALEQLVSAELIYRRGTPPNAEYTFKHALVQEAAYSTMLRSRRQQLHGRIAATLESKFSEIAATQPQVMAQHCAQGGLPEKAIGYWLKGGPAGRRALCDDGSGGAIGKGPHLAEHLAIESPAPNKSLISELHLDRH